MQAETEIDRIINGALYVALCRRKPSSNQNLDLLANILGGAIQPALLAAGYRIELDPEFLLRKGRGEVGELK